MKRLLRLSIPALVLVFVLILILRFDAAEGSYRIYVPVGYVNEVDRMIREGKLAYDCESERVGPLGLSSDEQYFYDNSYLRQDVEAWNDGDRRPFLVEHEELSGGRCEGRMLEANASHHNQRLPTYVADTWRGNLYLRQTTASTTLSSAERTVELVDVPWEILPRLDADAFEDVWFREDSPGIRSQRLAFKKLEAGRAFATLKTIGGQAALEVTGDRPGLVLNGCSVDLGWRLRLDNGDVLRVLHRDRKDDHYNVEAGGQASPVSFVSLVNGEPRRKTFTDRLAMARDVAWAIDAAVIESREIEAAPARNDFDVYLTLDAFLNHSVERQLGAFCRHRYQRRPLRAAVTVLEPSSGRILALASYPDANHIEDLELTRSSARRDLLLLNHNFLHHPVGSAAKPFLAAAALATRPALASLRLPCFAGGEPPTDLLGFRLGTYNLPPDCGGATNGMVDFDGFMTVSSNRYVLFLGLLAMATWDGNRPAADRASPELAPLDRYVIAGREYRYRPALPIAKIEGTGGFTELKEVGAEAFMFNFRDLFDSRVIYRRASLVEGLDLEYWRPVIDSTLGDTKHPANVSFSPITPEEVNLRANLMQNLRQDLYTTLLGTGNNRWSNIQLAQAMARLLTGRPVRARLLERVEVPAERQGEAEGDPEILWDLETELTEAENATWALPDAQRRLILDAMTSVVETANGTAHDLWGILETINRQAPRGVTYRALAKTGTPTSALSAIRRSPTTEAPGAIETYSGNRQVKSGVLVLAIERREGAETAGLVLSIFVEAQGESSEAVLVAAALLQPLIEAYWPEDWLERPSGG